jgi:hypothetical protein
MQGNGSAELPRADLPLPADNARRHSAETDNRPRAGHVTATTTVAESYWAPGFHRKTTTPPGSIPSSKIGGR